MENNPWKILSSTQVYENPWISLTEYQVINPGGGKGIYGKVHFKNRAVGIIPMDHEGNIYLVGQFRFALDMYSWEIPEGGAPFSEDLLTSAKRELKVEAGIEASQWHCRRSRRLWRPPCGMALPTGKLDLSEVSYRRSGHHGDRHHPILARRLPALILGGEPRRLDCS